MKRKIISGILAFAMLFCVGTAVVPAQNKVEAATVKTEFVKQDKIAIGKITVTGANTVNVRANAGTSYSKVGTVKKGATYNCYGVAIDKALNYWYYIEFGGKRGYIIKTYAQYKNPVTFDCNGYFILAEGESYVNVRSGPGTNYTKLGQYRVNEDSLPITGYAYSYAGTCFFRVTWNGKTGWISSDYLSPNSYVVRSGTDADNDDSAWVDGWY